MSLEEYARKRDFQHTPEPKPATAGKKSTKAAKKLPYFCIQRHDATRLHYDFRLEIGGTLKSWAVPKGPTLDPTARRLAAHVEDHPLEYGDFEGNIPEGNYGAGSVMLWDRGGFEVLGDAPAGEQYARGDLKVRLHGEKIKGDFAVVHMKGARGKGNDWLLIKKRDEHAVPGWNPEEYGWSVISGRTQEEIAQGLPAKKARSKTAPAPDRVWESDRPAARAARKTRAAAPPRKKKSRFDPSTLKGARLAEMPHAVTPMAATLADRPPAGGDWIFEVKWDGVRALCFIEGERWRILSRNGNRCDPQYPELSVAPHYISAERAILDGEIAVLDEKGISRFELIQPRIANTDANAVAHLARSTPVTLFLFDLLYLDGYDLRQCALVDRKRALEAIVTPGGVLRLSEHFTGDGEAVLEAARQAGLEGVLAKRAQSCYEGRRSRDWLKLKLVARQEFVICGFTSGEREYFGALVLGVWDDGSLVWVGNVGTGFTQNSAEALHRRMEPLVTPRSPFAPGTPVPRQAVWLRPELVCEVKFANWTQEGRLRAPVFLGLREDIDSSRVRREGAAPAPARRGPLLPGTEEEAVIDVEGKRLKLTNLNKVFYPEHGYAKRDLLNYYDAVAELILPHLKDRPLSLKRYPDGIHGEFFFQKNVPREQARWLRTVPIYHEEGGPKNYALADSRAALLYLVNWGCIDHNPWMSRIETPDNPDFVLIDLDPQECPFDMIVEAALLVKKHLDALGLAGYPKTTGGDGMHIYVPVEPKYSYEDTRNFAELLSHLATHERPNLFTTPRSVARRQKGRVYFDYLQNGKAKTIAAPYVLRAYPGAPVATPLAWREVKKGLHPSDFHIKNAPARFARTGDLFADVLHKPQRLDKALEKLQEIYGGAG